MVVSTKWVCRDAAHATVALREPAFVLTAYQRGVRVKLDHDLAVAVAVSFPVGVRGAMGAMERWRRVRGGSMAHGLWQTGSKRRVASRQRLGKLR
jgi:hypothetical protein